MKCIRCVVSSANHFALALHLVTLMSSVDTYTLDNAAREDCSFEIEHRTANRNLLEATTNIHRTRTSMALFAMGTHIAAWQSQLATQYSVHRAFDVASIFQWQIVPMANKA